MLSFPPVFEIDLSGNCGQEDVVVKCHKSPEGKPVV